MTGWFKSCFVFSSFGPLYFIVGLKLWLTSGLSWKPAALFVVLGVLAFLTSRYLIQRLKTGAAHPFHVTDIRPVDSEIFPYLMTYVPIFLENDLSDPSFSWPIGALYLLIFILYLRLDSPFVNPFFALFGLRVYEGKIVPSGSSVMIVAAGRTLSTTEEDLGLYEVGTGDLYYYSCGKEFKEAQS